MNTLLIFTIASFSSAGIDIPDDKPLKVAIDPESLKPPESVSKKRRNKRKVAALKAAVKKTNAQQKPKEKVQACPLLKGNAAAKAQETKKDEKEPCDYAQLVISASTSKHTLSLPKKDPAAVVDVIGGQSTGIATVKAELKGLSGPCKKTKDHENKTFDCNYEGAVMSSSQFKMDMAYTDEFKIFPWNSEPDSYFLSSNTCKGGNQLEVRVFPDSELTGEISFMKICFSVDKKPEKQPEYKEEVKFIEAKGEFKRNGGRTTEISGEFSHLIENANTFYRLLEKADSIVHRLKPVSPSRLFNFEGEMLGLVLKIESKFEEYKPFKCDWSRKVEFGFDPVVKLKIKTDILELVLTSNAFGQAIRIFKNYLEDNEIGELSLELSGEGSVAGTCILEKKAGESKADASISMSNKIVFELVGKVNAGNSDETEKTFVCEAGAEIGGSSEFEFPVELSDEGLSMGFKFNGIKLYALIYLEVGISFLKMKNSTGYENTFFAMEEAKKAVFKI